jgi:ERCC4-type nuclease
MELILDNRENSLKIELENEKTVFQTKQLIIGDIVIKKDSKELIIIERKTIADFYSSISSSRYQEQRERLKMYRVENPHLKIIYVIEGTFTESISNGTTIVPYEKMINTLNGATQNLILFHDIYILHTLSIKSTCKTLQSLMEKLSSTDVSSLILPSNLPVTKKAKMMENMFLLQLTLIPGVSKVTASKIIEKYPTLQIFLKESTLEELSMIPINKRRVGDKLAKKIFDVYF